MRSILQAIEDGDISLIESPPEYYADQDLTSRQKWIKQYTRFRAPSQREALEIGVKAFLGNPKLSPMMSHVELEKCIEGDFSMMQRQPAIMGRYRRYVVINALMEGARFSGDFFGVSYASLLYSDSHALTASWNGRQQTSLTSGMIFTQSKLLAFESQLVQDSCFLDYVHLKNKVYVSSAFVILDSTPSDDAHNAV